MDIQVLNEIANPARQAALTQVNSSVSANVQLKALKGNPVPVPGSPRPSTFEDSPEQVQNPVTPDISPVARAASDYSAVVGDGLNPDELSAVQDLAEGVRTAVSDFLGQPGLEQAENAADVVASNPEAVQNLTYGVEQAVVETLNLTGAEGEFIVNAAPPNEDVPVEVPVSPEQLISVERITNGAEFNNETQVIAVNPTQVNSRVSENTSVENPVTVEEVPESSSGDFRVTPASPQVQNAPASETPQVETPVSSEKVVKVPQQEPVRRLETVAVGPEGIPVSSPEAVAIPTQEPVTQPETVTANPQEVPGEVTSPLAQNAPTSENVQVKAPVSRPVTTLSQEPVSHPETVATNQQQVPATSTGPELQNAEVQYAEVANPVTLPTSAPDQGQALEESPTQAVNLEGITASPEGAGNQEAPVPSNSQPASAPPQAGPVPSNDLFAQENAAVNPENIRDVNELVNSVVENEFTSEAKKIFSEPKVIRTVADLADFILERLREIIITKQQQPQSNSEIGTV